MLFVLKTLNRNAGLGSQLKFYFPTDVSIINRNTLEIQGSHGAKRRNQLNLDRVLLSSSRIHDEAQGRQSAKSQIIKRDQSAGQGRKVILGGHQMKLNRSSNFQPEPSITQNDFLGLLRSSRQETAAHSLGFAPPLQNQEETPRSTTGDFLDHSSAARPRRSNGAMRN
jgi:hypothetical protein